MGNGHSTILHSEVLGNGTKNNYVYEQNFSLNGALVCGCIATKYYELSNTTMAMIMCVGGMYRIVNNKGQIRYANPNGRTVIEPRFAFGFPFKDENDY